VIRSTYHWRTVLRAVMAVLSTAALVVVGTLWLCR